METEGLAGWVIFLIVLFIFLGWILQDNENIEKAEVDTNDGIEMVGNFEDIDGDFVYDVKTGIVYVKSTTYYGYATLCPYYAANGLPYRYVDGKMVEVRETE